MYLKSLEISGFKSFAKKGFLEFSSSISAIVGPNGSGKSNVAEAFRFALGEQSLKSLRGKRGEDLIFSGSKNERPQNRASVKIVFDNAKRFLNIDYDEVSIERVVHRDGVNQYFINKSPARLKDISELLAAANIGSSGHHIISQGEADKILNVNLKERRGILEEALGLRVYQYKLAESEKKLLKVEENMKSVESLRREISPHLKFLSKQVKKIEQALELKEKLKILYKEFFKREDEYLKRQKNYIEKNKKPLLEEISVFNAELEKLKQDLAKEKNQKNENDFELENKIKEIGERKDVLAREIGKIEGMISFEERRIQNEENAQKKADEKIVRFTEVKDFIKKIEIKLEDSKNFVAEIKEIIAQFLLVHSESSLPNIDKSELSKLKNDKVILEDRLEKIREEEKKWLKIRSDKEKEKNDNQQSELRVFEINAKMSELRSQKNSLDNLESRITVEDELYKKELNEAFVLAGREAIQFFDYPLDEESIINEPRISQDERRRELERIKIKLEDMGGGSGDDVIKEFTETQERDNFLARELEDLEKSAESLRELMLDLKNRLDLEFKEGLEKINKQFQEFFATMFGGGTAELFIAKVVNKRKEEDGVVEADIDDAREEGIEINVSLPNKKTKGLQMLSGGERSLTSIALLFAMSQINPPPFIILDETDAALDEANSRRYGDMIEKLSKYSQLILITHNRETMSRAGVLYGITMGLDGVSKLLSVKLEEAVKVAK